MRGLRGVTDLLLLSSLFHLSIRCTQSLISAKWKQTACFTDQTVWWMLGSVLVMITLSVMFSFLCQLCKHKPSTEQPQRGAGEGRNSSMEERRDIRAGPLGKRWFYLSYMYNKIKHSNQQKRAAARKQSVTCSKEAELESSTVSRVCVNLLFAAVYSQSSILMHRQGDVSLLMFL